MNPSKSCESITDQPMSQRSMRKGEGVGPLQAAGPSHNSISRLAILDLRTACGIRHRMPIARVRLTIVRPVVASPSALRQGKVVILDRREIECGPDYFLGDSGAVSPSLKAGCGPDHRARLIRIIHTYGPRRIVALTSRLCLASGTPCVLSPVVAH